jgi:hypothetical protein
LHVGVFELLALNDGQGQERAAMRHIPGLALLSLAVIVLLFVLGCGTTPKADGAVGPGPTPTPTEGSAPPGAEILAPGVWKCPDDLTGALFFGSTEDEMYYLPDCSQLDKIEDENRICFATSDAARACGYAPCGRCP